MQYSTSVGGVTVSMVAFQAVDPGSIPGRRSFAELIGTLSKHAVAHKMQNWQC